jgi:hypothetical protein
MIESDPARQAAGRATPSGRTPRDVLAAQADWLEWEQPAYLVAALGRPRSAAWRALALEIERYRRASGISSPVSALGPAPSTRTGEGREWQRLCMEIAQYQGVERVGFDDLWVFPEQAHRVQEQTALSLLEACRWLGVLAPREIQTIIRMPSLVLRRHVTFAALLLGERPARSMKLAPLQVETADVQAHQAAHEGAVREARARLRRLRGRPAGEVGAVVVRLRAKLEVHEAALARLDVVRENVNRLQHKLRAAARRSGQPDGRSNKPHELPVAIGLHSAYELARRDLEALITLERDLPGYLARALGVVAFGAESRAAWRQGARLIERYRAEHGIDDPQDALGPRRGGYDANGARQEIADRLQALQVNLHRGVVLDGRDAPGDLSEIDLGSM